MKRAILVVLDSVGIGEMPDAHVYGDVGSNTLLNVQKAVVGLALGEEEMGLMLSNLDKLGLCRIDGMGGFMSAYSGEPQAAYGRFAESSKGKDTTTGHWEIAGLISRIAFPTYPQGFPESILAEFEAAIGRGSLANCPASGTGIISEYGEEHMRTGKPIVYTSADSVFQIAMHEEVIDLSEQYEICKKARGLLVGEHAVSRVIARPFAGEPGAFIRTKNRRDYSLEPSRNTLLDVLKSAGLAVSGVGKINDIFAGRGLTHSVHTLNNMDGVCKTLELMREQDGGLIFTNLVDFDMLFGHRNDPEGYAQALAQFDKRLPELISALKPEDILIITADHGCDPTMPGTDHSREYTPALIYGACVRPINLGTRPSFADIGSSVAHYLLGEAPADSLDGNSFLPEVCK